MRRHAGFVSDFLKLHDRDRYNATLVLASKKRPPVQALYAFGAEIAQVRERISEPVAGEIRLQWWVDVLQGQRRSEAEKNPLSAQLLAVLGRFALPTPPLVRLLAARRFDLYDDPMPDINAFEGYAGETNCVLYQLAAMIINAGKDVGTADAAGHLGVAHALAGHLRALGITVRRGQIVLPWSVFDQTGAGEDDYLREKSSPAIIEGCAILRQKARKHLEQASLAVAHFPADIRPVFAHIAVLDKQLRGLEKYADTPFITPPDHPEWQKIAALVWWSMRN